MAMEWTRGPTIGHGSFATVSLAKPASQNSTFPPIMAVKSCGVSHSSSLMNEVTILNELRDCPEIIKCHGDCFTVEDGRRLYNVALEYAPGGALAEKVMGPAGSRLPENEIRRYTNSILKGVKFIHERGFVHCDIKLQNILLVEGGVKMADFGLAKKSTEVKSKGEIRGTPMYMAPETVVGGEQGPASDIWAVGCLVVEMATGKPIWDCSDVTTLLMRIGLGSETPEIPGNLSAAGKDFVGKCLLKDPTERWTAEMLLSHPFVTSILSNAEDEIGSISPRDPFDFLDWELQTSCSTAPLCQLEFGEEELSPAARLRRLVAEQRPDWSDSSCWMTVR